VSRPGQGRRRHRRPGRRVDGSPPESLPCARDGSGPHRSCPSGPTRRRVL
jgi:hypothetical protein